MTKMMHIEPQMETLREISLYCHEGKAKTYLTSI